MARFDTPGEPDPFELGRFVRAQRDTYPRALAELRAGRKQSHWMWFIFPQMRGLGSSAMSQRYSIGSLEEARAYLAHPVLGARLDACALAVLTHEHLSAADIFGAPDDLKLRSSATLFARASSANSVFHRILARFFGGAEDDVTLRLLQLNALRHR